MSIERSRTAHPVGDAPRGLTMGAWGMWLTVTALTTAVAGFAAAGLYLHTGQDAWPPEGIDRPGSGLAVVALASMVAGTALAQRSRRRIRAGDARPATLGMSAGTAVLSGAIVVLARDLAETGFSWSDHAYTSVYWVLTLVVATLVGVGVLMLVSVAIQRLTGAVDATRMLELDVTVGYLWWVCAASVVLLAVVHLLPDPAGAVTAAQAVAP